MKTNWYDKKWVVIVLIIIFFPIGLYGLWKNKDFSKGVKIGITVPIILYFLISIIIGGSDTTTTSKESKTNVKHLGIIYDIPQLDGKNINQVIKILGKPDSDDESMTNERQSFYSKNGYDLIVTYNPNNKIITDYFISTNNPSGECEGYQDLLEVTNSLNNKNIIITPVPTIQDSTKFTGIKISFVSTSKKLIENYNNSKAGRINKKHPEWSKEDCENVAKKLIWVGMSIDMVVYERGLPNSKNVSNYGNGNQYQYGWEDYETQFFYCNDDGIVTAYN